MKDFETLFKRYDKLVFFDTETTGLYPNACQIIEIAAISLQRNGTRMEFDEFVKLRDPHSVLPDNIIELTGITDNMLNEQGKDESDAALAFADIVYSNSTLMIAHNANFDLSFVRGWFKDKPIPPQLEFLDTLTVFKDRRAYPHKLVNAIEAYNLGDKVTNSHRAIDDVRALVEVAAAMDRERNDLLEYVNLFGYNPRYGKPLDSIRGVRYVAQRFNDTMTTPKNALYACNQY